MNKQREYQKAIEIVDYLLCLTKDGSKLCLDETMIDYLKLNTVKE